MRSLVLAVALSAPLHASVIGTSEPAESLTAARVRATLPAGQQGPWLGYLDRSSQEEARDRAMLAAERAKLAGPVPSLPKEGFSTRSMPPDRETAYYSTPAAQQAAATILSFQLPSGGWSKNLDMTQPARVPGESWMANNLSRYPSGPDDFDAPRDPSWNYAGTLDNDATNTELHYLVRMSAAAPGHDGDAYRTSVLRGLNYLLAAQFPNGGWPQVWPLEGGYHDAITINDNAVTESAETLTDAAGGGVGYEFVPQELRARARAAAAHALDCLLATQVVVDGKKTVWAQQHDALTLKPVSGRNFEPAALSAGESSDVLVYLMSLKAPSPAVVASVDAGVAWLKTHAIHGEQWTGGRNTPPGPGNPGGGRHLEPAGADAPAIWPRYTSIATGKAVFGDRDKTIHDDVADLTYERRNGYAWYSSGAQAALDAYAAWKPGQS